MPKFFWVYVAMTFACERFGWWQAVLGLAVFEIVGAYATGFLTAWWTDRKAPR